MLEHDSEALAGFGFTPNSHRQTEKQERHFFWLRSIVTFPPGESMWLPHDGIQLELAS
ncbi:hypothetical protein BR93DRAFT_925436 [Coniochaeta sp. PMI_546]|nr:hypothetical protein BR93DRAFT_925436 [Coniochaeta sp. PMI_546]